MTFTGGEFRFDRSRAIEIADLVEIEFDRAGILIPGSSRIGGGLSALRRWGESQPLRRRERERFVHFLKEVVILEQISMHISRIASDPAGHGLLSTMLSDAPDPAHAKDHTKGRNAQFHLQTAAQCLDGQYQVRFVEPDLKVLGEFGVASVAAKRLLRSPRQIRALYSDAVDQLNGHGGLRIVALDLSNLLSPPKTALRPQGSLSIVETAEDLMKRRISQLASLLIRSSRRLAPSGILFHWLPALHETAETRSASMLIGTPCWLMVRIRPEHEFQLCMFEAGLYQ